MSGAAAAVRRKLLTAVSKNTLLKSVPELFELSLIWVNIYSNSSAVPSCDLGVFQEIAADLSKILMLATWLGQNLRVRQSLRGISLRD